MGGSDTTSLSSRSSRSSNKSSSSGGSGDRLQWGGQAEFILTLVGYAVGLGNVWRFPYLCYKNGGGAFLIPYFLMLLLVGLPVFYLEVSFGQFASLGPIKIWKINPLMKGLGISMVATNTMIAGYYCVIISWTMYFFFASMAAEVPWATCDNSWNTPLCMSPEQAENITRYNLTLTIGNTTYDNTDIRTSPEEYFYNNVLQISTGIDEFGGPVWQLSLTLLMAWIIVFLVLLKGIGSLGKVVYFTSLFPYVIMTVMVIRGCTLEGSYEGIMYYVKPTWSRLAEPVVWSDAATQIFYSLSTCTGGIIAMASFNKFDNNALRDSIIVPIINCLTSFYSGFAIFSVLGFMAMQKGVTVDEVAASGPGLVFVVYPEGLMQLPVSPVWSVLFFFMMMTLGFSSVFSMAECFFAAVIDEFPEHLQKNRSFIITFRALGCLFFFLFGFTMTFNGGFYLFNIVDSFTGGFPLLFVGLFEFISISYIYGFSKFSDDVEIMSGKRVNWFFLATWVVISPVLLAAVIIFLAVMYEPLMVEEYVYPAWGLGIGWAVVSICLAGIPLVFFIEFCRFGAGKIVVDYSKPRSDWGPALSRNRRGTKYERGTDPYYHGAPPEGTFVSLSEHTRTSLDDGVLSHDSTESFFTALNKASTPTDTWGPALAKNRKGTKYDRSQPSDWDDIKYTTSSASPFTNGIENELGMTGNYSTSPLADSPKHISNFSQPLDGKLGYSNLGYGPDIVAGSNGDIRKEPPPDYVVDQTTLF